jgi:flagellar hook assembly protein FlgD
LRRLAPILVTLALLGGTSVAFAVTQRLKLERSPITAPRFDRLFSPTCGCPTAVATLSLVLRKADRVTAVMVDARGEPARTLTVEERLGRGPVTYQWDGRTDAGGIAPDGRYRLRVRLHDAKRTILLPTTVIVDTEAPRISEVSVTPAAFSPDGDGLGDRIAIVYRSSEAGAPVVTVGGERLAETVVVTGRPSAAGQRRVRWSGLVDGVALGRGDYTIALAVRDQAGNASAPAVVTVRVRVVELTADSYTAEAGGRLTFEVDTDAASFAWYLFRPRGGRLGPPLLLDEAAVPPAVSVRIPSTFEPGAYRLRVVVNDRRDRASVIVTAP